MCSHRLAIAKLVREYREPLFSPSNQASREQKQQLWEFIRQEAVNQGAHQYARKTWKEVRDSVWAPIRRNTMAKVNKARTIGEDTVVFTEIDNVVLEILNTIGNGGADGDGTDDDGKITDEHNADLDGMMGQGDDGQPDNSMPDDENEFAAIQNAMLHNNNNNNNNRVEIKPSASLTQVLEMFNCGGGNQRGDDHHHQQQHQQRTGMFGIGGGGTSVGNNCWQQQQQQQQSSRPQSNGAGGAGNATIAVAVNNGDVLEQQQNALTGFPLSTTSSSVNGAAVETDLDPTDIVKRTQLRQLQLQNALLKEQIEEKRLQNQLLRMDVLAHGSPRENRQHKKNNI